MKVLISRKDFKDTTSGVPRIILQEMEFFHYHQNQIYVISEALNKKIVTEAGGRPVKTFKWPVSGFFRRKFYQRQVQWWIKKNRPDLVIGHGDILHQDILFIHNCVHLAHELIEGKPLPEGHEVGRIHSEILTRGSFKVLVANSQMMKNDLMKRFNIPEEKIIVQYPEFSLNRFSIEDPVTEKSHWRKKFGFQDHHVVIGMVTSGNFKKRNLGLLIDAFKEVSKNHPELRLFVAGKNISSSYMSEAPKDLTVFAPSIVDVKFYYNLLDVFILPAHIEEFGLSVLEAMFCGVPVITSKFVGASEIIKGRGREFIMEKTNKECLVKLIEKILTPGLHEEVILQNKKCSLELAASVQKNILGETLKKLNIHF